MSVKERLLIKDFFSITHFDWEIREFNILTGGMASGKSLCLKLLYFIEQILHTTIFLSGISKNFLDKERFFNNIGVQFNELFQSKSPEKDFINTEIIYSYIYNNDMTFDLSARWDKDNNILKWHSQYIQDRIQEWQSLFTDNTPDMADKARLGIYERIGHDFSDFFPIGCMFIPSSRAIATITDKFDIEEKYLKDFIKIYKNFVLQFDDFSDETVNSILHIKNILKQSNNKLEFELPDGRKINPLELSSGQQELIYLLFLIKNLHRTNFTYGKVSSIFIEEPSAHLFPQEQKESIEYIVKIFHQLRDTVGNQERFFISTHSPYVLNVVNNMLKKGHLIKNIDTCKDDTIKASINEEIKSLSFPHLMVDEISAYFIKTNAKVSSMVNESENGSYLYEKIIEGITQNIDSDYNNVKKLLRKIKG